MIIDDTGNWRFRSPVNGHSFTVAIAGDCCPHHSAIEPIRRGNAAAILQEIKPVFEQTDLAIVQFEAPLTNSNHPINKSGPNLKCPPECVDFVTAGGFDIALLANNHIGDFGPEPVLETIDIFRKNGVKTVGAGKNLTEAARPLQFEQNGYKIAILNVAEHEFGTAGQDLPGAAPLEPVENIMTIMRLADENDITIVITYGGNETNPFPSPRAMRQARAFADAGADAVINIHTHCPQGVELWNHKPIIYCPGNFFFPWDGREFDRQDFWWTGYVPVLEFDKQGALSLSVTPYTFSPHPWKIVPFEAELTKRFCRYLSGISAPLKNTGDIADFFDAWCALKAPYMLSTMADYFITASPIDYRSPKTAKAILPLRNRFTCESHHELIANFLRLVEEERLAEAEQLVTPLQELQKASFYP